MVKEKQMSIKLHLLSIWIPEFLLIRELEKTSEITNNYLDTLLKRYSIPIPAMKKPFKGNLEERRMMMAEYHNIRLKRLIEKLGFEDSLIIGRAELYKAGYAMGRDTRKRLGVKTIKDAILAARILYKVLGINFTTEENGEHIILRIKSCELANQYSLETCKIMSAADEGVLNGLNKKLGMKFIKRITEGAEECTACIKVKS
jgi:hypothetical protein